MNCICRPFCITGLFGASALSHNAPVRTSQQGVVFFCPAEISEITVELDKIKADGSRLIEFAAWPWDLPLPGSDLESRARTTTALTLPWSAGMMSYRCIPFGG